MPLDDPQVVAAFITSMGTIGAALIAAFVARKFVKQEQLKAQLALAHPDIEFLLGVEAMHCELHKQSSGDSNKNRVRDSVRKEGLSRSGKFTPGRLRG